MINYRYMYRHWGASKNESRSVGIGKNDRKNEGSPTSKESYGATMRILIPGVNTGYLGTRCKYRVPGSYPGTRVHVPGYPGTWVPLLQTVAKQGSSIYGSTAGTRVRTAAYSFWIKNKIPRGVDTYPGTGKLVELAHW
eukprot:3087901-Rhodomonas_salina.1